MKSRLTKFETLQLKVYSLTVPINFLREGFELLPATKTLQKIFREKSRNQAKVRQDRKTFISVLVYFFSNSAKNLFVQERLVIKLCPHAVLIFLTTSCFLRSYLNGSATREATRT